MNPSKALIDLFNYLDQGDFQSAGKLLSNDFHFSGQFPKTMGKEEFLNFQQSLKNAFPDLEYNLENVEKTGEKRISGEINLRGTQQGTLDLNSLQLGIVDASDKMINLPTEVVEIEVEDNKISRLKIESPEGGGLHGILQQLGAEAAVER